ncbi:Uncharacterised protein [Mycobacteroides abscessus subsp. abscessus]|nr:Uncharacterised protein [Mycobacteroides abscessus subsp. abscessus]
MPDLAVQFFCRLEVMAERLFYDKALESIGFGQAILLQMNRNGAEKFRCHGQIENTVAFEAIGIIKIFSH